MEDLDRLTTTLAIAIVMGAGRANLKKIQLREEELKLTGRALGWLTLVTVDTEYDFLQKLIDELGNVDVKGMNLQTPNPPALPMGAPMVAVAAGRKRGKKQRGGVAPGLLILGAIVSLFAGNTGVEIARANRDREIVRNAAISHIRNNCPADLAIGPGARPIMFGIADWEAMAAKHAAKVSECEAAKAGAKARVELADARLKKAFDKIPRGAKLATTAAVMVYNAPVAFTAPVIGAAGLAGGAAEAFVKTVLEGQEPDPTQLADLINKVDAAHKAAADEVKRQEEEERQRQEREAAAAPAPQGGRKYKRKTKKRVTKKRGVTRRSPTFVY